MEDKKNNKGLVCLIVILIVLVLGLVGYIVYDKVLLKDKDSVNTNGTTTIITNKTDNEVSEDNNFIELKDLKFPTENDNTVLVYGHIYDFINENIKETLENGENYKNVTYKINGFSFEESCTDYLVGIDEPSYCKNSEMTINEKIKINFSLDIPYSEEKFIMITDKNVIVQKGLEAITLGNIEIYDYQGNLIKSIEETTNYLILRGENGETLYESNMSYNMKLVNNKLHYIDASERVIYKTFDLETYEENIIGTINASPSQQY